MTRERDIERVLEAWFEPGPHEMPDRMFENVVDRIERVPQRRLAWASLRFPTMSSRTQIVAVAAVVIAMVAGIAIIQRPNPADVGASLSPSPSPSTSGRPVPADLQGRWMGGPRTLEGFSETAGTSLVIGLNTVYIKSDLERNAGGNGRLFSAVVGGGRGHFDVLSGDLQEECTSGAAGSYSWTLSPGGRILTLAANSDSCELRRNAYAGTWWKAEVCRSEPSYCLGAMEAGSYDSQHFIPRGPSPDAFLARFGALHYTVPDGWAQAGDSPSTFSLLPQREYATYDPTTCGEVCPDAIYVLARASAAEQGDACEPRAEPGVGRTAAELADWLTSHPGLVTGTAPVTVGRLAATAIDVSVAESWAGTCPAEPSPLIGVPLLTEVGGWHWAILAGDRYRLIPLDIDYGMNPETVVILVDTRDPSTFDAFVAEAIPIIESFEFE